MLIHRRMEREQLITSLVNAPCLYNSMKLLLKVAVSITDSASLCTPAVLDLLQLIFLHAQKMVLVKCVVHTNAPQGSSALLYRDASPRRDPHTLKEAHRSSMSEGFGKVVSGVNLKSGRRQDGVALYRLT